MRDRRRGGVVARLLVRGVLHRRGVAVLILLVAIAASAAAAVAPSYRSAAAVSALRARMTTAGADASGVELAAAAWPGGTPDDDLAAQAKRMPLASGFIRSISVAGRTTQLRVPGGDPEYAALTWREDECAHVVFLTGHCPTGTTEMALPASAAQVLDAKINGPIVVQSLDRPPFGPISTLAGKPVYPNAHQKLFSGVLHDTVVGTFTVPASQSSYWFGQDVSAAVENADGTQLTTVTALVAREQLTMLPPPIRANITIDQPLDWSGATPADVARVLAAVKAQNRRHGRNVSVFTEIPSLIRADAADRKQLGHLVTLAQLQLLLLVGLVLIAILAASMDRRRPELVIATLQGRRPRSTALSIAAEPVLLLAIGIAPGLLLSVPLAMVAAHVWLTPGTPVGLPAASVADALIVAAVAAVVTVAVAFVAASRSLGDQLAEDARSAGGRSGAWLDIVAITLAAAGLVELFVSHSGSTGDSATPWSLLAPSLTGLAAGLALGRLVPALLRPVVRMSAQSASIGRFLAIRELRRDRAAWRVTAMVALALSLLTFAVTVSHGASVDRTDRAGLTIGAPAVATVGVPPGTTLMAAVDHADPSGRWAMATELLAPFGSPAQRTLAVDTTRLAAVAGWSRRIDGLTPAGIERRLHVSAEAARGALPLLTAGNVGGSTFALNNEPLPRAKIYPTKVLPVLLGQGALADLSSLLAVAPQARTADLGTTVLINQVWLGPSAPADALARLRAQGLVVNDLADRAGITRGLQRLAQPAGLSGYLAVAVVAAVLALALLIGTSVAAAARQRTETLALTSAGVSRSAVIRGRTSAAALRLTIAGAAALGCGIGTAHLSARLIPEASRGTIPTPLLPLPVGPAVLAVVITVVPAIIAEIVIATIVAKRADAASLREALR